MIVLFKPNSSIERNEMLWNWILIPVLFLSIILLGNYGIFLGHTFFLDENNYLIFKFSAENIKSSGWRPDVGLGNTYLYGDPGTFHTWSLVRWWGHLFPSPLLAFNTSIIISLWVACIVQYIFLRKVIPGLGKSISFALAAMIAFGPDRYLSFFWQNSWGISPIIVPVIALLLYDFFKKPLIKHYFIYTLVLVLSLNLGSSVVLLHTIIFSGAFFLIIIFFNGYHRQWKVFLSQLGRFFLLNITAGFSIIILSGWTFYGIYIESQITEYVRDPIYGSGPFFFPPSIKFFVERLLDYIYSGIFAPWTKNLGIQQIVVSTGRNCPFPLFPIIFLLFLFLKTKNFWEYSTKIIILGVIFFQELTAWSPGIVRALQSIFHLRPPMDFDAVLHVFGIVATGICLSRIRLKEFSIAKSGIVLIRITALSFCLVYATLFIGAVFSIFFPSSLNVFLLNIWESISSSIASSSLKKLAPMLISGNINLFHEVMNFLDLIFYGLIAACAGLFITKYGFAFMKFKRGLLFSVVLAASQVFLSWVVYPMNSEPLIWDRQIMNGQKLANMFTPTDRIMRVGTSCRLHGLHGSQETDYYDCVRKKFLEGEKGVRKWIVGYYDIPALDLSSPKSVTPKDVSEFVHTLLQTEFPEMKPPHGLLRVLQRDLPLYASKFYDISAVKYLVSADPIPQNKRLKLIYSSQQFFLYKYLDSWPYFFLADQVEVINSYEELINAKKGVAYLWGNEPKIPFLTISAGKSKDIRLEKFTFDSMEFTYSSEKSEFLVVSDAWHPYWHAMVNDEEVKVFKANGIFKGISLPPGQGTIKLYFDNSPYMPGIWVSVFGWVFFLGAWLFFALRTQQFKLINSNSTLR